MWKGIENRNRDESSSFLRKTRNSPHFLRSPSTIPIDISSLFATIVAALAVKNYVRGSFLTVSGCKDIVWVSRDREGRTKYEIKIAAG